MSIRKDKFSSLAPSEPIKIFKMLLDAFTENAAASGISVVAYTGDAPRFFQALSAPEQQQTLENFARYAEVCHQTIEAGESLTDDKATLWRFIKKLGVRQNADLFSLFEEGDIIEVYDLSNFVQIFRNLRFFSVCSYTLDDILCRPFWELYLKDTKITQKIVDNATTLAKQEATSTLHYDGTKHSLFEIDSSQKYHAIVENRFIAPLFDQNGRTIAAVHVMRCHSLSTP